MICNYYWFPTTPLCEMGISRSVALARYRPYTPAGVGWPFHGELLDSVTVGAAQTEQLSWVQPVVVEAPATNS